MLKVKLKELPDYSITKCGRIFNDKTGNELKFSLNKDGYYVIVLRTPEGKRTCRRRARLLGQTFIPNPNNLPVINHIDHNRTNDSLDNLEWVTHRDNNLKSIELFPEKHRGNADIDEQIAHKICQMIQDDYKNSDISETLNVPIDIVKHIRSGNTWKEVSKNYTMKRSRRGVPDETIIEVCKLILKGLKNKEILSLNIHKDLTNPMIKSIRARNCHKHITYKYLGNPEGSEINP
jgi:hypothetical protein